MSEQPGVNIGLDSDLSINSDKEAMRSMLSAIPTLSGNEDQREMAALRDSFLSQVPPQSLTEGVRTCWQELWAKSMAILTPSQMQQLGKAFVFAAHAHADQ